MRTDPRKACANEKESWLWAILHDGIAHPLMALTNYSIASVALHDYTSQKAWPRKPKDRPAKTGLAYWTASAAEAEFWRQSMIKQGLSVWSRSTPLGDGKFHYEVGPL